MKKLIALASVTMLAVSSAGIVLAAHWGGCHDAYGYGISCGGWGSGSWGSGSSGWGNSSLQRDYCPDGDMTFSYYDGMCDEGVAAEEGGTTTDGSSTTTTTTTTTDGGPITVVTTTATSGGDVSDDDIAIITEALSNNSGSTWGSNVPANEVISLPAFLPETGASL